MRVVHWFVPFVLAAGCGAASVRPHDDTARQGLVAPGTARIGDRTWCLVSGEAFTVTDASPKVERDGKVYYFCCVGCDKDFAASPEKYLGRPPKNES